MSSPRKILPQPINFSSQSNQPVNNIQSFLSSSNSSSLSMLPSMNTQMSQRQISDDNVNENEEDNNEVSSPTRRRRVVTTRRNGFDSPTLINDKLRNFIINVDIGTMQLSTGDIIDKQQLITEFYPYITTIDNLLIGTDEPLENSQRNSNYMITKLSNVNMIFFLAIKYNNLKDPNMGAFINLKRIDPQIQAFTILFVDSFFEDFGILAKEDREFNQNNPNARTRDVFHPLYFKYVRIISLITRNQLSFNTIRKALLNNDQEAIESVHKKNFDLNLLRNVNISDSETETYNQNINKSQEILQNFKNEYTNQTVQREQVSQLLPTPTTETSTQQPFF
jgi:hypothetical protein